MNSASEDPSPFQSSPKSDEIISATPSEVVGSSGVSRGLATRKPNSPVHTADLIERIRESAEKLASDHTSRGDLKILSRTLQELRYAFKVFGPYRSHRKVTVFGSARTPPHQPAYEQAVQFGRTMAEHGWLVVTGASSGIMEAGHVGAGRAHSMGLNILLPFEQSTNAVIAGDPKLVHMKYFFTRKLMFVKESNAMCCLPGGFGTLDEGLEVLTLLQTGKRDMVPVVFLDAPGGDYWQTFQEFIRKSLLARGMICPEDLALYRLTDKVEDAVQEVLGFYRVYHSMRYVHESLVLRLQERPGDQILDRLHEDFADILVKGKFTVSGPLEEERDEPLLADLPRLVFVFTRNSFGRLRQLIDFLNHGTPSPGVAGPAPQVDAF
ncbi:MAG: TIGR00730 family Rossman fold protein [Thermoguttaceae bacterium]